MPGVLNLYNETYESMLMPTAYLSCLFIFIVFGGCRFLDNKQFETKPSELSADSEQLPELLSDKEQRAIFKLADTILGNYEADEYVYVFVGRSPAPIQALFSAFRDKIPDRTFLSIPLSNAADIPKYTEVFDPEKKVHTDYFTKLMHHFDIYLGEAIKSEITLRTTPRKILLIDFAFSGESLAMTKRYLDFYLRYMSSNEGLSKFLDVKTEYLAIVQDKFKSIIVQHNFKYFKLPYKPSIKETLQLSQVEIGHRAGNKIEMIDLKQRADRINQNMDGASWHWKGHVITLKAVDAPDSFIRKLRSEFFDRFSRHGSWDIEDAQLHSAPVFNKPFQHLENAFTLMCRPSQH